MSLESNTTQGKALEIMERNSFKHFILQLFQRQYLQFQQPFNRTQEKITTLQTATAPPDLQWTSFDFVIAIHQSKEIVSYYSLDDEWQVTILPQPEKN